MFKLRSREREKEQRSRRWVEGRRESETVPHKFIYLHNYISHLLLLAEEDVCGPQDKASHIDIAENGMELQAEVRMAHTALATETVTDDVGHAKTMSA